MSLGNMAVECKLSELYSLQYKPFCTSTHASPEDISTYVDFATANFGYLNAGKEIPGVLWTAGSAHLICSEVFIQGFGLQDTVSLGVATQQLTDLESKLD